MNRRWDEFRSLQRNGQSPLFELDFPDPRKLGECFRIRDGILELLSDEATELKVLLICLVEHYGICFSLRQYVDTLKNLERDRAINVRREPKLTQTGRSRQGWDPDSRDYKVYISKAGRWQQTLL